MSISLILLYYAQLAFSKTNANILSQSYDMLSFQEATGPYSDSHFLSVHSVYPASFTSTGDYAGHNIEFAFHDDGNYWVSKEPNTDNFHNTISVTFSEPTVLEAFLLSTSYKTTDDNKRHYCGFPTKFKVYTAMNDNDDFTLNTVFTGTPTYPLHKAQFVFKKPIECKRLQFEFIEVTEDIVFSEGAKNVNIGFLNFIKHLNYNDLEYDLPSGDYSNSVYTDFHRIPDSQFEYDSSGHHGEYKIENAFDNDDQTFWIADTESDGSSTSHIIINFKKPILFEGFLLKGHYYNKYVFPAIKDFYPGIPTKLELYVSQNDDDFVLNSKYSGNPKDKKDTYQFILSQKVLCDRIMIKFIEAVNDEQEKFKSTRKVVVNQLFLYQGFENEGQISQGVNGNYANSDYLSTHTVSADDIKLTATGGSQENHDITTGVVLDGKDDTYWVSKEPNTDTFHNCVIVNFTDSILLEAILIDPVYQTDKKKKRTFSGFPTRLNVYSSLNDDEFKLVSTFIGMPDDSTTRVQFVLQNEVNCTRLKLEFVEVTPFVFDNDGSLYAGVAGFVFVKKSDYDIINYHENKGYAESRVIPKSKILTFWSTGDSQKGPVSNLFDDDDGDGSYWESSFKSDDSHRASVFVNFTESLQIDELLLGAYKGNSRNYGFPTKLNVYISNDDHEELKLVATFIGSPGSSRIYQFTFREPISCSRIQLEFVDSYDPYFSDTPACLNFLKFIGEIFDFSGGDFQDYFTTQHVNKSYPLHGLNDTSLIINDLPSDNDYLFVVEKKFYFDNVSFTCPKSSMSAIKTNNSNNVIVKKCKFNSCTVKSSIGSGGAILSLNCALKCEHSHFTNCNSKENGGGGGIFVVLNEKTNSDITIDNCNFTQCSASFGGAIYLYSNIESNKIIVQKCSFISNKIINPSEKDALVGGSAIYMNTQSVIIKRCKFAQNAGESSIKIDYNFEKVPSNFLDKLESKSPVEIENCEFEIGSNAKSSISYVHGLKNHVNTVVSNCIFNGQLLDDAHHIIVDSKHNMNKGSILSIQSCKFACDKTKSINLNLNDLSNSLVVFNLDNQVFNYNGNDNEEKAVFMSKNKKLFIAAASIMAVAIVALIAAFATVSIVNSKKENDTLNHPLDNIEL